MGAKCAERTHLAFHKMMKKKETLEENIAAMTDFLQAPNQPGLEGLGAAITGMPVHICLRKTCAAWNAFLVWKYALDPGGPH